MCALKYKSADWNIHTYLFWTHLVFPAQFMLMEWWGMSRVSQPYSNLEYSFIHLFIHVTNKHLKLLFQALSIEKIIEDYACSVWLI